MRSYGYKIFVRIPSFCTFIYIINENILRIWYNRYKYDSYISLICSFLSALHKFIPEAHKQALQCE